MKPQIKTKQNKMTVECLSCGEGIHVGDNPKVSRFITCKRCEMVFEIINVDPILIDWPYCDDDYIDDEELYDYE